MSHRAKVRGLLRIIYADIAVNIGLHTDTE